MMHPKGKGERGKEVVVVVYFFEKDYLIAKR